MTSEIVVSGLGAVGAYGLGRAALAAALAPGAELTPVEVDRSAGYHREGAARLALLASGQNLSPLLPPGAARRLSPPARFSMAATRLALDDAGLGTLDRDGFARTAVLSGTSFGPPWVTEQLLRQIYTLGPEAASPALFTESVASASASQVALAFGARGPSLTFTGREASDLLALGAGFRLVRDGAAERALVVVVEEMIPLLHALLGRFGALARGETNGDTRRSPAHERARPFDRDRTGALAAEGAVVAVLEARETLEARGGRALCAVHAAGSGFDPSAEAWRFGEDAGAIARRLARGLERCDTAPESIDLVAAGASGSPAGDRLLALALRGCFGDRLPPIVAPKGRVGEWGGGYLGAALLHSAGTAGAPVAPASGFRNPDPELGIEPCSGALEPPRRTLAATVSAGGGWAWTLLGAPGEPSLARVV